MSGSCTVTPGIVWSDQLVEYANLNLAANPIVQIGVGQVTDRELDLAGLITKLGDRLLSKNYLLNGNFDLPFWDEGLTSQSVASGVKTTVARYWFVKETGGTITYIANTTSPETPAYYSLKITGGTSVADVDVGQDIPAWISRTARRWVVISAYILNNTGGSITPQLRINTADVVDDFSAVTNQASANFAVVPASPSTWQRIYKAIDLSLLTNAENGIEIVIRIPSGSMDSTGKIVQLSEIKMESGVDTNSTPTAFIPDAFDADIQRKAVGGRTGYTTTALTSGTITLTAGTSKIYQEFTGTLAGAQTINVTRTSAREGDRFYQRFTDVVITPSNTLTLQENASGSVKFFNTAITLNAYYIWIYTGSAWKLFFEQTDRK